MLHASTQKLIQKLCDLTQAGEIVWQEGPGEALVFETEGYRVEAEGNPPSVRLLRNDGKELESASAADLLATPWPGGDGTYAARVADMVRRAKREARGADLAISQILSSLSAPARKPSTPNLGAQPAPEPPPSPHTVPEPPVKPPHGDTAIDAVLSPKGKVEVEPAEAAEEPELETAGEEAVAEAPPTPRPEPQFKVPAYPRPDPPRAYSPVRSGFGGAESFARHPWKRSKPAEANYTPIRTGAPPPASAFSSEPARSEIPSEPKVTSTGLFITGISATTRQVVGVEPPLERRPPPAPAAQEASPEPKPEPKREPAPAADIYKPWS
jgi:hypothetical protein